MKGVLDIGNNIKFQSIAQTEGYYLVKDFRIFMEYLFNEGGYLAKKSKQIAPKFLYELNQRITYATRDQDVNPKTKLSTYHELQLFQHLADGAKLYDKGKGPNGNFTMLPNDRYKQFCALTETEQYFVLLETLWVHVDWQKLTSGSFGRLVMNYIPDILDVLKKQQTGVKLAVESDRETSEMFSLLDNFVAYLSYFGFWEVERFYDPDDRFLYKSMFKAESITVTDFGKQMMQYLNKYRPILDWSEMDPYSKQQKMNSMSGALDEMLDMAVEEAVNNAGTGEPNRADIRAKFYDLLEKEQTENEHNEPFIQPFISMFPEGELQQTLSKQKAEWKRGAYTFKVTIEGGAWRRVVMNDMHDLEDLHNAIQDAFDFDNDHLYAFYMDGRRFSDNCYNDPVVDEGPYADQAWLGSIDLVQGQEFLYLFDFGDEWRFTIKLEKIDTESAGPDRPQVIAGKGEAPEQYAW